MKAAILLCGTVLLFALACTKSNTSPTKGEGSSSTETEDSSSLVDSDATIKSLTYDAGKHSITAELSYGGCAKADHRIVMSDICAESYPMQCGATLKRSKSFDSKCKMAITETVELKFENDFDTAYVNVLSGEKTVSVLVDREGKTKNINP